MTTISFTIPGTPIAKQRHRISRGIQYDPQHKEKTNLKWLITQELQKRNLKALEGAIGASIDICYPIPKSWSKKRQEMAIQNFVTCRPDTDNYLKFYFDVMNNVAYHDDSQISQVYAEKTYSKEPCVKINLYSLEEKLINEHAITYKDSLSLEDLNYIIKKANRLGLSNRQLMRVYQEEDAEGKHIYFEVENLKGKK